MDDLVWCTRISASRRLCVSPLSVATIQENDPENLGSAAGYFIYEVDERPGSAGISILGKAASEEAAMRLVDIFLASTRGAVRHRATDHRKVA
jgi:hypothetical protein